MRLIDVAIPRLTTPAIPEYRSPPADFALKPSLFGLTELGYVLDDVDSDVTEEAPDSGDEFFEAEDGSSEVRCTIPICIVADPYTAARDKATHVRAGFQG